MNVLPDPYTPHDCDLRGLAFMPLDVLRLRDSHLSALEDAEAFRANVMSWCVAWHQVPAGSLPDDDLLLCRLLGYGRNVSEWRRLREAGALHGYVKCSDGRLYHGDLCRTAMECWSPTLGEWSTSSEPGQRSNAAAWSLLRAQVFERDGYHCRYCGEPGPNLQCDHVRPVSRGGTNGIHNLLTACLPCNVSKADNTLEEWRLRRRAYGWLL